MATRRELYDRLGAEVTTVGGTEVPARFANPARARKAVRNGVGVTEHPWGAIAVGGADRRAFLEDTLTCRLPPNPNEIRYGFLLEPEGAIDTDLYLFASDDELICLVAPGTAPAVAETWDDRTFIQDVTVRDRSGDIAVIGVHGPTLETKFASVLRTGTVPSDPMTVSRGAIRDIGVTLCRLDAPTGEPGVAVICPHEDASAVFEALATLGAAATPFGDETWQALTLEAGTPLYRSEFAGRTPNECGQVYIDAVALEKGCFVGQEAVARVANLAQPTRRLIGVEAGPELEDDTELRVDGRRVGQCTRSVSAPGGEGRIAFAFVKAECAPGDRVEAGGESATLVDVPFLDSTASSGRLPRYEPSDG